MYIEINLSIEKSGGRENLDKLIAALKKIVPEKYPEAEIVVRKGFFQTIDGIYSDNSSIENDIMALVNITRQEILSQ